MRGKAAAILIVLAFALTGCDPSAGRDYELDARSFDAQTLNQVERESGIVLPPNSRGMHFFYQGSKVDPSFFAKVMIPKISYDSAYAQIERIRDEDISVVNSSAKHLQWWNPGQETVRVERRYLNKMNFVHLIFCEEKGEWFLYVEWISD